MKIPCKNCLILPICRHKGYHEALQGCEYIRQYVANPTILVEDVELHKKRCKKFESYIKPTRWRTGGQTEGGYELYKIGED